MKGQVIERRRICKIDIASRDQRQWAFFRPIAPNDEGDNATFYEPLVINKAQEYRDDADEEDEEMCMDLKIADVAPYPYDTSPEEMEEYHALECVLGEDWSLQLAHELSPVAFEASSSSFSDDDMWSPIPSDPQTATMCCDLDIGSSSQVLQTGFHHLNNLLPPVTPIPM